MCTQVLRKEAHNPGQIWTDSPLVKREKTLQRAGSRLRDGDDVATKFEAAIVAVHRAR